jgi:hypothetical protein
LVGGKTLELDASSISFQENVELPGRPSVEFVMAALMARTLNMRKRRASMAFWVFSALPGA